MSKNLLNMYEEGMDDEIYEDIVKSKETTKRVSKNKILGRQDLKREKFSYIAANKKAAKKSSVNTYDEIAALNKSICRK